MYQIYIYTYMDKPLQKTGAVPIDTIVLQTIKLHLKGLQLVISAKRLHKSLAQIPKSFARPRRLVALARLFVANRLGAFRSCVSFDS